MQRPQLAFIPVLIALDLEGAHTGETPCLRGGKLHIGEGKDLTRRSGCDKRLTCVSDLNGTCAAVLSSEQLPDDQYPSARGDKGFNQGGAINGNAPSYLLTLLLLCYIEDGVWATARQMISDI